MKVKEILELSMNKPISSITKDHLTIGEKKLREALKVIGCTHQQGKRGWIYNGDLPEVLEQSIYDFVQPSKTRAKAINNASIDASEEIAVTKEVQFSKSNSRASKNHLEKELDKIDRLLMQTDSNHNKRMYRGFYWDADIISIIDNVKHGNKSDLMNEIVRTVLKAKGLVE